MRINRHDTNGAKPLLGKGELGYDDYTAGGDIGRVYVGTSTENIALAKRLEANTMTKAQFNALAEERKASRAGSGWDEWGKHNSTVSTNTPINEGLWTVPTLVNSFIMGAETTNIGVSKTLIPYININGVKHTINKVASSSPFAPNSILLPTAPNIYPYDTVLTAEQIASGVIKHADSSNSGLIVNGKFDTDTTGWYSSPNFPATSLVLNGKIRVTATNSYGRVMQGFSTTIGKKYIVRGIKTTVSGSGNAQINLVINSGADALLNIDLVGEFIATSSITYMALALSGSASAGAVAEFDNIEVYPADAISRQDFVFIKQNIENIATKDFFVPLGNKQYLGGDVDGITGISVGAFSGATTSSLFGTWQVAGTLVGKGYVWSTRTEAQKKALLANPENNAYLDGADIYQATYMAKVINLPNDNYTESTAFAYVGYTQDSIDKGLWTHSDGSKAVPVALVHRRNQGMYHPVYNANGSKKASDGNFWYNTAVSFTSISDCFDPAKLLTASGYIGSVSGRPDGLFYDQVHEGDITDLRNSSKKVEDYNRLIGREFNKLVAGTYRGKEGEIESIIRTFTKASAFGVNNGRFYFGITGTSYQEIALSPEYNLEFTLVGSNGSVYNTKQILNVVFSGTMYIPLAGNTQVYIPIDGKNTAGTMNTLFPDGTIITVIVTKRTTRTKSNTLLHCDIIGNPTNYPTAWKQSGVFGTPLIVAEDGTSLLPNGALDTFKLSRKANGTPLLCLRSTDNGATWTSFTPTFSTTTNAITLIDEPATNLVMVYYQTHTSMAVPVVNSEVLEIGDVFATTHYSGAYGGYLSNTLISKSPTSSGTTRRFNYYKLNNYPIQANIGFFMTGTGVEPPSHMDANLLYIDNTPAIKVFPYLTRLNGKAYLNLVFKEMKYNGTSWGDDSKFNIVNNVSTTTDNNAQIVLIGQKMVELPYFIGADE